MHTNIMLVEDDMYLREGLCELLEKEGYTVKSACNCSEGRQLFRSAPFQLVILDVMLPDGNGLELCTEIRRQGYDMPILFLTACDEEFQIVRGLDAGADDYITKPFKLLEFLSRVRALLRRRTSSNLCQSKAVSMDINTMSVKKNGESIMLTPTEFQILATLIQNSGIVVTRNALLERIWDSDGNFIDDNTLSVHISRLRDKIGGEHIVTVRGAGYRWEESP